MGIRYFDAGGVAPAATGATETTVSDWAAPLVGGVIQRGLDIASTPYQVYGGNKVAGSSDLQNSAFSGIQGLTQPNSVQTNATNTFNNVAQSALTQPAYQGTTFTSNTSGISNGFDSAALNQYMNPYLQDILNPQLAQARRNASLTQMKDAGALTKAGAFGGSRQALVGAENSRNMNMNLADITGKGYDSAFKAAQGQFNSDQDRLLKALQSQEQSGQFGAKQGLEYLTLAGNTAASEGAFGNNLAQNQLAANRQEAELGGVQRGITQAGLDSDYADFKEQRDYPKTQLDYFNNLISKYPMTTTNQYGEGTNGAASILGGGITALSAYNLLSGKKP
jgi:hypothetical protein